MYKRAKRALVLCPKAWEIGSKDISCDDQWLLHTAFIEIYVTVYISLCLTKQVNESTCQAPVQPDLDLDLYICSRLPSWSLTRFNSFWEPSLPRRHNCTRPETMERLKLERLKLEASPGMRCRSWYPQWLYHVISTTGFFESCQYPGAKMFRAP